MTVRAADLALRDLIENRLGRDGVVYQLADGRALSSGNMVELEKQRVRNAAVNTRVTAQVRINEFSVPSTIPYVPIDLAALEFRRPMIVFTPVRLLAQLASRMPAPGNSVLEKESLDRF